MTRLARFEITAAEIDAVVTAFYAKVRAHKVLAPVFFDSLPEGDEIWNPHEAKIARFWRNAILMERGYDGNPQRVHSQRELIQPEHFELWLGLFDETLNQLLTKQQATAWSAIAHRIGGALRMGVIQSKRKPGDVPIFG